VGIVKSFKQITEEDQERKIGGQVWAGRFVWSQGVLIAQRRERGCSEINYTVILYILVKIMRQSKLSTVTNNF